ncbi:hypothetical protein FGO68_gene6926 [Halteria grandinella]|uniref:Uncharacterized protein n=1 Tax=Halteria grandinella TaxID=5974 RepID=A0A8J8P6P3_HALGN|nr:hypothetical protein FGO68_gene6926 [Halteria grandinella]
MAVSSQFKKGVSILIDLNHLRIDQVGRVKKRVEFWFAASSLLDDKCLQQFIVQSVLTIIAFLCGALSGMQKILFDQQIIYNQVFRLYLSMTAGFKNSPIRGLMFQFVYYADRATSFIKINASKSAPQGLITALRQCHNTLLANQILASKLIEQSSF